MTRPGRSARRSARNALGRLLEQVKHQSMTTVPKRVVGRRSDGLEEHLRLDGTCPTVAGIEGHQTGQITLRPAQTLSYRGAVGVGASFLWGAGVVRVERQEPRLLERGAVQVVDVYGRELPSATTWQYLSPPTESAMSEMNAPEINVPDQPHPKIEIHDVEAVDRKHHRLTVEVAGDAELIDSAPLAYDVGGRPPGPPDEPCRLGERAEDLYGIQAPTARYLAYWQTLAGDELAWLAAWLGTDGTVQSFLGHLLRDPAYPDAATQAARSEPIFEDASGRVGRGSLIQPASDRLVVLDFEAGVRHVSESFDEDHLAGAAYVDGDLMVVTHSKPVGSSTAEARLLRMPTDLGGRSTVTSIALGPVGQFAAATEWYDARTVAIGSSSAYVSAEWADFNLQQYGWQAAVLPFEGEPRQGPEPADTEARGPDFSVALPHALGALRGDQLWAGGLGADPDNDPAWRRWTPQAWGAEGGPSTGALAVTYDGAVLREADPSGAGDVLVLNVPEATHPELGPVGRPQLIFPAF